MQDILTSCAISVMGPNRHIFNEASSWNNSKQTHFAMLFAFLPTLERHLIALFGLSHSLRGNQT